MQKPILMQYWGGIAPPEGLSKRMKSCKVNNPDLRYKLISPVGAAKRLNRWFGEDIANSFLSIRMEAMRSDVFRVAWLLRKGGYYVDAASQVLAPFNEWIDKEKLNLLKKPKMINTNMICNGFIYAPSPGHPFLQEIWSRQENILLSHKCLSTWHETGPGVFRDVLETIDPQITAQISIHTIDKFNERFRFGSSNNFIDRREHWSKREARGESLFTDLLPSQTSP